MFSHLSAFSCWYQLRSVIQSEPLPCAIVILAGRQRVIRSKINMMDHNPNRFHAGKLDYLGPVVKPIAVLCQTRIIWRTQRWFWSILRFYFSKKPGLWSQEINRILPWRKQVSWGRLLMSAFTFLKAPSSVSPSTFASAVPSKGIRNSCDN